MKRWLSKYLLPVLFVLLQLVARADELAFDWVQTSTNNFVAYAALSNHVARVSVHPPHSSRTGEKIVRLSKVDFLGVEVWAREFQLHDADRSLAFAANASGYAIAGGFSGTNTPGIASLDGYEFDVGSSNGVYAASFDSEGNIAWARAIAEGLLWPGPMQVARLGDSVWLVGTFPGTYKFDGELKTNATMIARFNAAGEVLWKTNTVGAPVGLEIDAEGNAILLHAPLRNGLPEIIITKFSSTGNLLYNRPLGEIWGDVSRFKRSADGTLLMAGRFYQQGRFVLGDESLTNSQGGTTLVVAKFRESGEVDWVQRADARENYYGTRIDDLAENRDGTILILGNYAGLAAFGRFTAQGLERAADAFFATLSSAGEFTAFLTVRSGYGVYPKVALAMDRDFAVAGGGSGAAWFGAEAVSLYPTGSFLGRLRVNPQAPIVQSEATDLLGSSQIPRQFVVHAAGEEPLHFQWRRNGVDLPGGTNDTLALPLGPSARAGIYTVAVSNEFGSALSKGFTAGALNWARGIESVNWESAQEIVVHRTTGEPYVLVNAQVQNHLESFVAHYSTAGGVKAWHAMPLAGIDLAQDGAGDLVTLNATVMQSNAMTITRWDAAWQPIWHYSIQTYYPSYSSWNLEDVGKIACGADGSIYLVASTDEPNRGFLFQRISPQGQALWTRYLGDPAGLYVRRIRGVEVVEGGDVLLMCYFPDPWRFNIVEIPAGSVVMRFSPAGELKWFRSLPGYCETFATDAAANIYTTATLLETETSVWNKSAPGLQTLVLLKVDANGNLVTARSIGTASGVSARDLVVETDGSLVRVVGEYRHFAQFGPQLFVESRGWSGFYLKVDGQFHHLFALSYRGDELINGDRIAAGPSGVHYIAGRFFSEQRALVQFNGFALQGGGGYNAFLMQLPEQGPVIGTYDIWSEAFSTRWGDPRLAPGSDPDLDGFTNAEEFTLGYNPLASEAEFIRISDFRLSSSGEVRVSVELPVGLNLQPDIQVSSDLQNWADLSAVRTSQTNSGWFVRSQFTLTRGGDRVFLRAIAE